MRHHLHKWTMVIMVLIMAVVISVAQDEPTITVTPDSGAVGTGVFEVTVDGLIVDETYVVEFIFDGAVVFSSEEVADEDGVVTFSAASQEDDDIGTYTVQVVRNDLILAATEFEITAADTTTDDDDSTEPTQPVETVGNISITPASGPISTLHTITLSDLEPDIGYTVEITAIRTEEVVYRRIWTSDEDGNISIEIYAEDGDTTGQQVVTVFDNDGQVVAQDEFTIDDVPVRVVTLDVTPTVAQAGREFTITIDGLVSFDNVSVQVISDSNLLIDTLQARASSEGVAILSFLSPDDLDDGEYKLDVMIDGVQVAESSLTIGDAPVAESGDDTTEVSDVNLTVDPEAAPIGDPHVMIVTGLRDKQPVTLTIMNEAGEIEYSTTKIADESGEFSIRITTGEGDEIGSYSVEIADATSGQVIASGQMVITEGDVTESTETDTTAQTGAPTITVDPASGEIGTTYVITLSGMPAGKSLGVVVRAQRDDALALSSVVRIDDNGESTVEFTSSDLNIPGVYNVTAVRPSGELASTTLTIEGALATIEPQTGVLGSTHEIAVSGLDANETVTFEVSFEDEVVYSVEKTADANGETLLSLTTEETDATGDYTITVVRESGNQPTVTLTATEEESAPETTDTESETDTDTTTESITSPDADVIEGNLENGSASIDFSGEEGQYIIITVASDAFDTVATVYNEDYFEIAYNDDSGGTTHSQIGPLLLPYTGDYILEVRPLYDEDGENEGAPFTATIQPVIVSSISLDEPIAFSISPEQPALYYELPLEAGSSLDISVDSDGTLDTQMEILDSNGYQFAYDDDGGSGLDPEFTNLIVTQDDTYILIISSFVADSAGEGTVTVTQNPVKSLDEGSITVNLSDKAYTDLAVFDAEEGDVVTLNLEKISGHVEDLYVYATVDGMQVMYYTTMGIPDHLPLMFVMPMSGEVVVTFEEFGYGDGISFDVTLEKE